MNAMRVAKNIDILTIVCINCESHNENMMIRTRKFGSKSSSSKENIGMGFHYQGERERERELIPVAPVAAAALREDSERKLDSF